ncbi:MAG: tRNA uridine-5-carboxymethylaminomethyl(34) synthesis enzyme MnmG [Proteobacteria bacterium]|nr:MAG: tRNA uridine-5-carboxymethylaminomethyl(34) synthesis enzyme MnmG [Pseudomonadota bacterium]PIE19105.1 MAG: tRNA uridine-5-carboxymethylaminomethyl(34) synthesis enzyme MnmG [Pseudomonadota bacterium]
MDTGFDILVVGAGHAGVEAALAAARLRKRVALLSYDLDACCRMPCNPALGGLGKGHLVREIDALGGQQGIAGDASGIHFRRLNTRKGAAVRGTRVQCDKQRYSALMGRVCREQPGLRALAGGAAGLRFDEAGRVCGVRLEDGSELAARITIITTGTFLGGMLHVGDESRAGGRQGEPAATALSSALTALGLPMGRLKTGTPCRLDRRSLDYEAMEPQPGDVPPPRLSAGEPWPDSRPPLRQVHCHITYTNAQTHELIRANLDRSAIFSGAITSRGPRYCPSIEDKIVRFADRDRHQIFVEPEGLDTELVYPNGISTSLPHEVQEQLVRSIRGFERAEIVRYGYAVEYDYVDPTALEASLAVRGQPGLYLAGQINGTTGYEEAAAQGLLAGINAARELDEREPLVLRRDQAYAGVLIDDLVTRGVGGEPYRMFTSRAEYRLLLREDNAADRLTPLGRELGLIGDARWARYCAQRARREQLGATLAAGRVPRDATILASLDARLEGAGTVPARVGQPLIELLRRPEVTLALLRAAGVLEEGLAQDEQGADLLAEDLEALEIAIKYAPYIERQELDAARLARLEAQRLPHDVDYQAVCGLSREVVEKLEARRPRTLAQAQRIPGITPAALALLQVHCAARERAQAELGRRGEDVNGGEKTSTPGRRRQRRGEDVNGGEKT